MKQVLHARCSVHVRIRENHMMEPSAKGRCVIALTSKTRPIPQPQSRKVRFATLENHFQKNVCLSAHGCFHMHAMIAFPCVSFYECCPTHVLHCNLSLSLSHACHVMNASPCMFSCPMYAALSMHVFLCVLPCMLPSSDWHLKDFFKSNWVMLLEMRILRRHVSKSAKAASKRSLMLVPSQR